MKKFIILCISSICFYAASQDSSTALISEINMNQSNLIIEAPNNFNLNETVKSKKDSTAELKKLQAIEQLIKNLEKQLKDSLTKTLKNLPSMVYQDQLDAIKSLTSQNDALMQEKLKFEADMASLIVYKNSAEANLNNQKNDFEKKIGFLEKEKTKAETDKNTVIANKTSEWEAYIKSYVKNEKFISTDLFNKLKVQISSNATLTSDLETFQIHSKRLAAAEDFLYLGNGTFKTVYTDFKNTIDAAKYPKQANAQKELQAMFDLFLIISDGLYEKLDVIKASNTEILRTEELKSWRYYKLAVNFPYLKDLIQKNFKKHTPLNFDPKNP